jgi:hypothetical protein
MEHQRDAVFLGQAAEGVIEDRAEVGGEDRLGLFRCRMGLDQVVGIDPGAQSGLAP